MTPAQARSVLTVAAALILASCFVPGAVALAAGAAGAAALPAALFALAAGRRRRWPLLLGAAILGGLSVAFFWPSSPHWAGLPAATWTVWLLATVVPFACVIYGAVWRPDDDAR